MNLLKYRALISYIFIFLTIIQVHSQEVDAVTSATTTLYTRFLKHSFELGAEIASQRSDLEVVVKSINRVFKKNYPFGFPTNDNNLKIMQGYNRELTSGYIFSIDKTSDIISTGAGLVIQIGFLHDEYGNFLIIKHDDGFYSLYGGLDNIIVKEYQLIKSKQNIARINNNTKDKKFLHYGIYHTMEWDSSLKESTMSYISINPYEFLHN